MTIQRREFLRMAVMGCACCSGAVRSLASPDAKAGSAAAAAHGKKHWSYEGEAGPEHWGELTPEFKVCQLGMEQTPVDLTQGLKGDAGTLALNYRPVPMRMINNGHTIQVNVAPGCSVTIGNVTYDLVQFHFHHPSEHLLDGKSFDLEVHFVHKAASGALAVIGVFFAAGAQNPVLQPIFDGMPQSAGPEVAINGEMDPAAFLPAGRAYFRYMGSLTTPPCSEGLTWTVFRDPIEASPAQVKQFAALFPNNARPVQPQNRRFIIETSSNVTN